MNSELLINFIIYSFFAFGAVLILWDETCILIARYKLRHRLKAIRVEQKQLPMPLRYLENLINVSFEKEKSKIAFLIFELVLFIISYILGYKNFGPSFSAIVSLITIAMPVLLLAVKLEASRAKASKEGISLVSELYRQYRINNLNIYEALEKTINVDGDFRLSSKRLYSLLMHIRSSCGIIEMRDSIDKFVFSYGTSWARMLGICIRLSAEKGVDVSKALADIASQLKDAYDLEEKRRMMNSEASRMTLLLIPLMYTACMLAAVFYLGQNPFTLIRNQFLTPKGYLLLLLIVFLFLINFLLLFFINNSKLDY